MLTTFGTFWAAEGFGYVWPLSDWFILVLAALYLLATGVLVLALKQSKQHRLAPASVGVAGINAPEQEVVDSNHADSVPSKQEEVRP